MERAHRNSRRKFGLVAVPLALASVVAAIAAGLVTGSGEAASAVVPSNTSPPTISGTTEEGKTLTAARGRGPAPSRSPTAYQWRRCDADGGSCSNIGGAKDSDVHAEGRRRR